jgi:DNA ligase 1
MSNYFKPMLAAKIRTEAELDKLPYPVLVQPKIDGIRCIVRHSQALSRKLLKIPNDYIRNTLSAMYTNLQQRFNDEDKEPDDRFIRPRYLDGELIVKDSLGKVLPFNDIQSAVMSKQGTPSFTYVVFDILHDETYNVGTMCRLDYLVCLHLRRNFQPLFTQVTFDKFDLLRQYQEFLCVGYEGIIIRAMNAPYKFGRGTLKSGPLWAYKNFTDAEAKIMDWHPYHTNINELESDELGYAKRSHSNEGKIALPMVGTLICEVLNGDFKGKQVRIGSGLGFTQQMRKDMYVNWNKYKGRIITFKYQGHGSKDMPRILTFKCFRDEMV